MGQTPAKITPMVARPPVAQPSRRRKRDGVQSGAAAHWDRPGARLRNPGSRRT